MTALTSMNSCDGAERHSTQPRHLVRTFLISFLGLQHGESSSKEWYKAN